VNFEYGIVKSHMRYGW